MPLSFLYHFPHLKFTYKSFAYIESKNGAPLIWSIAFDSTTSVTFTIAGQSRKRANSGAVGTKCLSLIGNQQVKWLRRERHVY